MAVLIMGIDLPDSCADCPCEYDGIMCQVTGESFIWDESTGDSKRLWKPREDGFDSCKERLPSCPLAYVKEVWATKEKKIRKAKKE